MFELSQYHLGEFEVIRIFHKQKNIALEVIPAFGARLNSLQVGVGTGSGIEVIDGFSSEEDIFSDKYYKSAFLFPFPNRLKDGTFSENGVTYSFPLNERIRHNAIHGFIADLPFEVEYINTSVENAEIKLVLDQSTPLKFYPFTFKFSVTYKINTQSDFEVKIKIENTSPINMPFGLGWHPYFTFPEWADAKLKISEVDQVELNERALPSGNVKNYKALSFFKAVDNIKLDDCFILKCNERNIAHLQNDKVCLTLWRDVDTIPYLQLFTPEKNCIAIEPMTCNVDALNNKMGMVSLEPGNSYTTSFGTSVN
ncbi:aldose 1-epimerase [Fulvivirga sp. 29W222]|uniref:Aldose 1-epimerase n=1 Tax=Fulvivirga marina TaxID=2494733 RepID=A0A937KE17_9BACT|nr:aldose 1-epimerase [Fulvivirga marina]MBL6449074.1 aldose 1-epimerase [Fulvivirga marina]